MKSRNFIVIAVIAVLTSLCSLAQESKSAGVVPAAELQKLVPASYFYGGQTASVQVRNSGGIRTKGQKYVIAALVDTSGYSSNVAEKYQGLLITEVKVKVGGSELNPGQYGFGFVGDKVTITDVGTNSVASVSSKTDDNLQRPVPLKIIQEGGEYRLYHGKKYVTLQVE